MVAAPRSGIDQIYSKNLMAGTPPTFIVFWSDTFHKLEVAYRERGFGERCDSALTMQLQNPIDNRVSKIIPSYLSPS
jgi:hypothetical protein